MKAIMGKTFRNEEVISTEEVHAYNGWGHSRKHRHVLSGYRITLRSKKPTKIDCIPEAYEGTRTLISLLFFLAPMYKKLSWRRFRRFVFFPILLIRII